MAQSNPSLFRWRRRTEKFPSQAQTGDSSGALSKQSLTAVDDVQDWIKKVQKASDRAAVAALGPRAAGRTNGYTAALETVDQLREHDATYNEAQELLNTWMTEKVNLDFEVDDEDWSEVPSAKATAGNSPAHGMLDSLLEENYTFTDDMTDGSASQRARDFYSRIENDDDDSAVQQILSGMMDLEVLDDSTLKELESAEDSRPRKDPVMTMEMRQRKVKEARDRRQRELEQKRREKQRKKDAKFQAAQMVLREEREKALRAKREEEEIQHIMAHMRKEMYEQQRLEMEAREKERQMREAEEARLLEQRQRQREDLDSEYLRHWQKEEEERLRQLSKNAEVETLRRRHNLRCLQRHFSAWYRLIVARRVQYGKARAMADWKSTLRAWNAWRTYVLSRKTDKETRKYQRDLIDMQRKQQAAVDHDRRRVLQRCLQAWVLYVHWEQDRKELYRKQEETRSKMSALLEAAASGKLWSARGDDDDDDGGSTSGRGGVRSDRVDNGQRRVDELFEEPVKRQASAPLVRTDRSDPVSTRSEKDRGKHARRLVKPTEPWQVNKKHLGLSNNTLAHLTETETTNQDNNRQEKEKLTQPKKPYIPNTYEHRYTHQQQALEEQKRQIKEQKRLIEELQEQQRLIMCQQDMQKATAAREAIEEAIAGQGSKGKRAGSRPDSARSDSTDASSAMSQTDTCVSGPSTAVSRSSSSKTRNRALREADPIVKKMEERAAEREEKKRRIEERKKKKEEERVLRLQEEEEARRQAEEEEKRARLERVREEKRLIRQRELEKQERLERQAELNTRADEHYTNSLLRNRGWGPWRKLVNQSRHNMQVAVAHHTEELLRRCLVPWYDHTQEVLQHKADMATEFCNFITVRRCFRSWRRYGQHQSILEARAERHRQLRMREKCFRVWMDYAMDERLAGIGKGRMAAEHNIIRLQRKAFRAWQQLPVLARKERERERRRTEMRKKVANILPDFQGLQLAEDKEDFTCSLGNIKMKL